MIGVQLPTGETVYIDTTDPEAAVTAGRKIFEQQQTAKGLRTTPAPPIGGEDPNTSWMHQPAPVPGDSQTDSSSASRLGRAFMLGLQGVGSGLAAIPGSLVDIASLPINLGAAGLEGAINLIPGVDGVKLPRVTEPLGGTQSIRDATAAGAKALGVPIVEPEDMTTGQRLRYNIDQLGAESLGFGGATSRAGAAARALLPERSYAAGVVKRMEQPYRDATEAAVNAPPKLTPTIPPGVVPFAEGSIGPFNVGGALAGARPYVSDLAAGAGAGLALSAVEPYNSPIADFLATTLGGAGGVTAANIVQSPRQVGRFLVGSLGDQRIAPDPNTGAQPSRRIADQARSVVQREAMDPEQAAKTIREGAQYYSDAGMTPPTSGLLSNDEGLLGLETGLRNYSSDPGEKNIKPQFVQRDRKVSQGASDQLATVDPGDVNPRQATDFVNRAVATRLDTAQQQVAGAKTALDQAQTAETTLGGQVKARQSNLGTASENLDKAVVDETMRPMQERQNDLYSGIDPTGAVQRDAGPAIEAVQAIRSSVPKTVPESEVLPERWLSQIEQFGKKEATVDTGLVDEAGQPITRTETSGGTIPFKDLNEMRPYLANAIKGARQRGEFTYADNLTRLKGIIDDEAERLAAEGGEAGQRAQEATRFTREEVGPRFGQGEGGRLRADINADDLSRSNTPPTATAQRFLKPLAGGKEAAADLQRILADQPSREAGMAAARDYVLADMAKVVGPDDKINPARLRTWIANRKDMLDQLPEIRAEVERTMQDVLNRRQATTQLQKDLETATGNLKRTQREIQDSALSLVLNADPTNAVKNVFSSRDPQMAMREIWTKVEGDPDAAAGWKKALSDYLTQTVTKTNTASTAEGARNVSLAELTNLFTKHEKVLAEIYDSKEMMALRRAQRAMTDLSRKGVRASSGSPTAESLADVKRLAEITLKGAFGQLRGGGMMRTLNLALKTVPGLNSEKKVVDLLVRAHFDPELAAHLLETPTTPKAQVLWNKRLTAIIGLQQAGAESTESE